MVNAENQTLTDWITFGSNNISAVDHTIDITFFLHHSVCLTGVFNMKDHSWLMRRDIAFIGIFEFSEDQITFHGVHLM